jgi:hypothetical protein
MILNPQFQSRLTIITMTMLPTNSVNKYGCYDGRFGKKSQPGMASLKDTGIEERRETAYPRKVIQKRWSIVRLGLNPSRTVLVASSTFVGFLYWAIANKVRRT